MAFKVEKKIFDWDIEIPIITKNEKGEVVSDKTEIIKCVHVMNTEKYNEFMDHIKKYIPKEEEKEVMIKNSDQEKGIVSIIKQIDFLYKKGADWWITNVEPQYIFAVQKYILSFTDIIGVKKTS